MKAQLKRLLAKTLAVVMVFSMITVPTLADSSPVETSKYTTQTAQNLLDKTADVTLSVKGVTADTKKAPSDVVLVLDISGSMGSSYSNSLPKLQEAAKVFVDKLLTESSQNRVAIVSYSTSGTVNMPFSSDKSALNLAISNLVAGGGTNMHAGMLLAKRLMTNKTRSEANKSLVFMSDGMATYYLRGNDTYRILDKNNDSYKIQHVARWNPYNYHNEYYSGWADYAYVTNYLYAGVTGPGDAYDTDSNNAVQLEATALKNAGVKMYTVGLGVNDLRGTTSLTNMASASNLYYPAPNAAKLDEIYAGLATTIAALPAVSKAVVTDTIPDKLACTTAAGSFIKKVNGVPMALSTNEVTISGKVITWNVGDIAVNDTVTLTYSVKADDSANYYGAFYTNESATLSYARFNGSNVAQTQPVVTFVKPVALIAPTAVADTFTVPSGSLVNIPAGQGLMVNDIDTLLNEGSLWSFSTLTAVKATDAQHGTVVVNANGSLSYKSVTGYLGTDTFTYKLSTTASKTGVATQNTTQTVLESKPVTVTVTVSAKLTDSVKVAVTDATGLKGSISNYSQFASNTNSTPLLHGDARADISYSGTAANKLWYQFSNVPITDVKNLPINGWIEKKLDSSTTNPDVMADSPGKLNRRSYDVTMLPNMGGADSWNDRSKVYKYPFEATEIVPATVATSNEEYGYYVSYLDHNNAEKRRYKALTVFGAMNGTGDLAPATEKSSGATYQESSKFWGYFKAPTTGTYNLGLISDDGSTGTITVNGASVKFSSNFMVQGSTWNASSATDADGVKTNSVQLTAGQYYPIFLEYFNWGGGSRFQLYYALDNFSSTVVNKVPINAQLVPAANLYPSKSDAPGEYADTVFTGATGVSFPTTAGDYYVLYKATNPNNTTVISGSYGPFTYPGSAELTLGKTAVYADGTPVTTIQPGKEFDIKYTVTPKDIIPTALHNNASTIYLDNVRIQDDLMDGFNVLKAAETNQFLFPDPIKSPNNYTYILPDIQYVLTTLPNGTKVYRAVEATSTYTVKVSLKSVTGTTQISKDQQSILTFIDPCDGAQSTKKFDNGSIVADPTIIDGIKLTDKNGGSEIKCVSNFKFVSKLPFTLRRPTYGTVIFEFANATVDREAIKDVTLYKGSVKQTVKPAIDGEKGNYTVTVPTLTATGLDAGSYVLYFNIDDSKITHAPAPIKYNWNLSAVHVYDLTDTTRAHDLGTGASFLNSAVSLDVAVAPKIE